MFNTLTTIKETTLLPTITLYGGQGIGKTTFCALFSNPVFIVTEKGLNYIDVPNPENVQATATLTSFDEIMGALRALYAEPSDRKTIIVDSIDWAEQIFVNEIKAKYSVDSLQDSKLVKQLGYAGAYEIMSQKMQAILGALNMLRKDKGFQVILICHSAKEEDYNDPLNATHDRWVFKLNKKLRALVKEWSDIILYAHKRSEVNEEGKPIEGARVLQTGCAVAYESKCIAGIPDVLPLDSKHFQEVLNKAVFSTKTTTIKEVKNV